MHSMNTSFCFIIYFQTFSCLPSFIFSTNRLEEHIIKRSDMPDHLVRDAEGYMMLKQIETRVCDWLNCFRARKADTFSAHKTKHRIDYKHFPWAIKITMHQICGTIRLFVR